MRHSILIGFLGCGVLIASIGWSVGDAMGVEIKSPQLEDPRPEYKKDAIDHASEISDLLTRRLDAPTATGSKRSLSWPRSITTASPCNAAPLIADTDPDVSLSTLVFSAARLLCCLPAVRRMAVRRRAGEVSAGYCAGDVGITAHRPRRGAA